MASMITMFLQSAYSMIDGLFVSNLIGDTALSAVNVAWPIIAVELQSAQALDAAEP